MPPRDPFNRHLPERLHIRDGPTLATVADARAYILSLTPECTARAQWQHAMQLILDSSVPVDSIWRAVKLALLYDAALDVSRTQ